MNVILLAQSEAQRAHWTLLIEDLGPSWQCMAAGTAAQALDLLRATGADVLLLLPGPEVAPVLAALTTHPPLVSPWVLGPGAPDGPLPHPEALPPLLAAWRQEGRLPGLASAVLPRVEGFARAFLMSMGAPEHLAAWAFLPCMLARTVVHPPLLTDLQHGLYRHIARECRLTPGAVERRLRLWIEAAWERGDLDALERYFGQTVDPERGKPTNREFLCGCQAWLTRALSRLI